MGTPRFGSFLFGSLRGYRRGWLRADLLAGLAVWAVLVPESLAYAVLAGVPPVVGLWAAPAALVLYAAVGSSRHLVVGPMCTRILRIAESADPRAVVLDAETIPAIDVTAAQMLAELEHNLLRRGTRLLVARDVGQVRDVLRRVAVPEIVVGVYPTVDAAVEAALGSPGGDDTEADGRDADRARRESSPAGDPPRPHEASPTSAHNCS